MKRIQGHGCWKLLSQWEKVAKCNFKSNAQYMKEFLSHEWNVIAMQKTDFMFRAFFKELRSH